MRYASRFLVRAACLFTLLAGCGGCVDQEGKPVANAEPPSAQATSMGSDKGYPPGTYLPLAPTYRVIGHEDDTNRYSATVVVTRRNGSAERQDRACSGVLLAPNRVLTAAHCLCPPVAGTTSGGTEPLRHEGSACVSPIFVVTYSQEPRGQGESVTWLNKWFMGHVRPHPQFQVQLDAQGAILTSRADLAVIHLQRPVDVEIRPIRLATRDVTPGEVVTVVGHPYAEDFKSMSPTRLFTREKVSSPVDGERMLLGSQEEASYKGDTGGPCLRETGQQLELVGISQRGLGRQPTLTRIAPYREWLEQQIHQP